MQDKAYKVIEEGACADECCEVEHMHRAGSCCENEHKHHKDGCCENEHKHHKDSCCEAEHKHHKDSCCESEHKHHADSCCENEHCCSCSHHHGGAISKVQIARLAASAVFFAAAVLLASKLKTVSSVLYLAAYLIVGADVIINAVRNIFRGKVFDEAFLMTVASIGAMLIGEYPEGVTVMLFFQFGELLQSVAINRSEKSIAELMDIRPDYANLSENGTVEKVAPEAVKVGDKILIYPGEKVPLDCVITDGVSDFDMSALTGESVPVHAEAGDAVLSGSVNQSGAITAEVTAEFAQSTVSKILDLVKNADAKKAKTEKFITVFARYYTPAVVALAALIAILPPLILHAGWNIWIYRALLFLVISCPCALVVSVPLGFFAGIGGASKHGVLIKGSNFLEALGNIDTVVFDKTGTLTKGVFEVSSVSCNNGFTQDEVLKLAACAESFSLHPIALSVQRAYKGDISKEKIEAFSELSGYGISVKINGSDVLAGNAKLLKKHGVDFEECPSAGTSIYVAADGVFAGCLSISDVIKDDAAKSVQELKKLGVSRVVMLTGDSEKIAEKTAKAVGADSFYAELLPDQKVKKLEELLESESKNKKLAFVGDGINDAPVLARADVGIAMGALGSDAAVEAADAVLMNDELSKLPEAIRISRFTKKIVIQNIALSLISKLIVLVLGAAGLAMMWEAVFVDVGVCIICVLNSMRAARTK